MAFGVLTTNSVEEALARAGEGAGNKGHEAAVAAIEMAEVVAQLTRQADAEDLAAWRARGRTRATGPARRRCRSCISGTSARRDIVKTRRRRSSTCSGRTRDPPADDLRDVRHRAGARHRGAARRDRSADRRHRRALAAGADGGPRPPDPAHGGLRDAARPATPPAVVINEALELARTFSTEESVKFINGMLDAIRKKIDARDNEPLGRRVAMSISHDEQSPAAPVEPRGARRSSASRSIRARFERQHTISDAGRRLRPAHARRARGRARHDRHERPDPRDPLVRQGELPGAVRRPREDPGLHPPGRAAASSTSRSTSCSTSATGSASKGGCSAPRPTSSRSGRRGCTSWRSACCRCRRSGTA